MDNKTASKFLTHVVWYVYNVPAGEIIDKVYGNPVASYRNEKIDLFYKNQLSWFADLDDEHKERFCQLVMDKYNK